MSKSLTHQTIRGTIWSYISFYAGKILVFISTIILARLLSTEDFGVAGYALTVLSFLEVFSDFGIGSALIFYKDDDKFRNSAFWLGLLISTLLLTLSWFSAPAIGQFFNDTRAIAVTRAIALNFPFMALGNVQDILLRKKLAFQRKFIPDFTKAIFKGIFSIILAVLGFGAWSLVLGQLIGTIASTITLWIIVPWKPALKIHKDASEKLLQYGRNIVLVDIVAIILNNADYLLIGRYMNAAKLGLYTMAFRLPDLLILQFCSKISRVIFPAYSKIQNDLEGLAKAFMMTLKYVSLITVPIGLGIFMVAKPLVIVFFSEKWIDSYPILQALAIYAMFLSFSFNAGDVYKAQGRPQILSQLSLLRMIFLLPGLYWAVTTHGNLITVGWVHASVAIFAGFVELIVASKMIKVPLKEIFSTLSLSLKSGLIMVSSVFLVSNLVIESAPIFQLVVAVLCGGAAYLISLWLFSKNTVLSAVSTLKTAFSR
jgi:PST family polysaccharide transporter